MRVTITGTGVVEGEGIYTRLKSREGHASGLCVLAWCSWLGGDRKGDLERREEREGKELLHEHHLGRTQQAYILTSSYPSLGGGAVGGSSTPSPISRSFVCLFSLCAGMRWR